MMGMLQIAFNLLKKEDKSLEGMLHLLGALVVLYGAYIGSWQYTAIGAITPAVLIALPKGIHNFIIGDSALKIAMVAGIIFMVTILYTIFTWNFSYILWGFGIAFVVNWISTTISDPAQSIQSKPTVNNIAQTSPDLATVKLAQHLFTIAHECAEPYEDSKTTRKAMQEILWMYVNCADRVLFSEFGPEIRDKAMNLMDAYLPEMTIEALCSNWSDELKVNYKKEFSENMKLAESEYGGLKMNSTNEDEDIFTRCALIVMDHAGQSSNQEATATLTSRIKKYFSEVPMYLFTNVGNTLKA